MDKLGSIFYVFQTPGISLWSPYSLLSLPPSPLLFPPFFQLAAAPLPSLSPYPSYLLVCNLFAGRLSL